MFHFSVECSLTFFNPRQTFLKELFHSHKTFQTMLFSFYNLSLTISNFFPALIISLFSLTHSFSIKPVFAVIKVTQNEIFILQILWIISMIFNKSDLRLKNNFFNYYECKPYLKKITKINLDNYSLLIIPPCK